MQSPPACVFFLMAWELLIRRRAVKLFLRIPLLLAMVWLALEAIVAYACRFKQGYPLWPLLGLAGCFWAYTRLRPDYSQPKPVVYDGQSLESTLFLALAVTGSAVVLHGRGEQAWTPVWFLHMAVLTFFQLLVPYLAGRPFARAQASVTAIAAFLLLGLLWKGSDLGCCSVADLIRPPAPVKEIFPAPPRQTTQRTLPTAHL